MSGHMAAKDGAVPQPHPSRMVEFRGHPIVVAVVPGQSSLVALTAASLARATKASQIVFAHVDQRRCVVEENTDGSVVSVPIDPDAMDGDAETLRQRLTEEISTALGDCDVLWCPPPSSTGRIPRHGSEIGISRSSSGTGGVGLPGGMPGHPHASRNSPRLAGSCRRCALGDPGDQSRRGLRARDPARSSRPCRP